MKSRKRLIFCSLLLLFLFGCKSGEDKKLKIGVPNREIVNLKKLDKNEIKKVLLNKQVFKSDEVESEIFFLDLPKAVGIEQRTGEVLAWLSVCGHRCLPNDFNLGYLNVAEKEKCEKVSGLWHQVDTIFQESYICLYNEF